MRVVEESGLRIIRDKPLVGFRGPGIVPGLIEQPADLQQGARDRRVGRVRRDYIPEEHQGGIRLVQPLVADPLAELGIRHQRTLPVPGQQRVVVDQGLPELPSCLLAPLFQ